MLWCPPTLCSEACSISSVSWLAESGHLVLAVNDLDADILGMPDAHMKRELAAFLSPAANNLLQNRP